MRIGAVGIFVNLAKNLFPFAQVYPNTNWQDLIDGHIDVHLNDKTSSILWSLEHQAIVGIDFGDALGREYICYALPLRDRGWKRFVNQWLSIHKLSGFYAKQHKYWFQGESL